MRETLSSSMPNNASFRITPAYAGNTTVCRRQRLRMQDHPRVCGKHWKMRSFNLTAKGSPPRMRETLPVDSQKAALRQDHPRVCGKHGSFCTKEITFPGITPAYAGNTYSLNYMPLTPQDHPRVCGKHQSKLLNDQLP